MLLSQPIYALTFYPYMPPTADGILVPFAFTGWQSIWLALMDIPRWRLSNVFTTLLLGQLVIWIYQTLDRFGEKRALLMALPALLLACVAADFTHSDYEGFGVLLIFALYIARDRKKQAVTALVWSAVFYMGWASWNGMELMWRPSWYAALKYIMPWLGASAASLLMLAYNGQRGRPAKWYQLL